MDDVITWLKNELTLGYCKALGVPMDMVDGRPWVRTHNEMHDPFVWGNGDGGCGHPICGNTTGANLTGLFQAPRITTTNKGPSR